MTITSYTLISSIVIVFIYMTVIYNRFVSLKHNSTKAWSNIDILLKQRHEELPKLVELCKQYMRFEKETLTKIMQARSGVSQARESADIPALGAAEHLLRNGLSKLFAVSEAYPELRANENFQHLQTRITGIENAIADRREFYNDSVNNNNILLEQFPDVFIARLFNFKPFELLRFDSKELEDVDLKTLFSH